MAKTGSEDLFFLIKSLSPSEKRYFKVFANNSEKSGERKYLHLFDLIDQQEAYREDRILEQAPSIKASQLSNLKAHLYKKILQSLRQYSSSSVLDLQIRELIDQAQLLYNRSLYTQCAKMLEKAYKLAVKTDNLELMMEALKWQKKVLTQTIGKNNLERVNQIIQEVRQVNRRINNVNSFTNLSVRLNSLYMKIGIVRKREDFEKVHTIFTNSMPDYREEELSFNEKLHLYSLLVGYYFFVQDFENGYRYAYKWEHMFGDSKELIVTHLDMYIRALNSLMISQYKLWKYTELVETKQKLKFIRELPAVLLNQNIRHKLTKYTYVHEFNAIFMLGDFSRGVALLERIGAHLEYFISTLDKHSRVIFYFKVACLYFGNSNFSKSLKWLNRIISTEDPEIRQDVHCFSRIMALVAHYELQNTDVIEYYIRSTYQFLLKMNDFQVFQRYILSFLRKLAYNLTQKELINEFELLRNQLLSLEDSEYEKSAFIYFDIISWLESRIQSRPIQEVIRERSMQLIS